MPISFLRFLFFLLIKLTLHTYFHLQFTSGQSKSPFCITPSYTFWAPWIGRFTRGCTVYNTEYRKCAVSPYESQVDAGENEEASEDTESGRDNKRSEDDLVEMMEFTDV